MFSKYDKLAFVVVRCESQKSCDRHSCLRVVEMIDNTLFVQVLVRVELEARYLNIILSAVWWILDSTNVVQNGPGYSSRPTPPQSVFLAGEKETRIERTTRNPQSQRSVVLLVKLERGMPCDV